MRNKLPVNIEKLELPNEFDNSKNDYSYGYVNILLLTSILTTIGSIITIIVFRK